MAPVKKRGQDADRLRHEIGNLLTVAQANLEGMIDGVVEPTLDRLESIRDALAAGVEHLKELSLLLKDR